MVDPADPFPDASFSEKRGRIILAGGEILHKSVCERVLFPALDLIYRKYSARPCPRGCG